LEFNLPWKPGGGMLSPIALVGDGTMLGRTARISLILTTVPVICGAGDPTKAELQLGRVNVLGSGGSTLLLGSVGPDARTTGSYTPARGGDPYYFNIPSQRPPTSAPGLLLRIPLGSGSGNSP
jgi:hypothetical protein